MPSSPVYPALTQSLDNEPGMQIHNHQLRPKIEMQKTEYNKAVLNDKCQAMLIRIDESDDSYYDQYIIYPVYEKNHMKVIPFYTKY